LNLLGFGPGMKKTRIEVEVNRAGILWDISVSRPEITPEFIIFWPRNEGMWALQ
jgi:hypothetical protein